MKSVLISIQPKWCELIASGKKTVEVRKTKPKMDEPFKCYIYCTKQFYRKGDGYFQGKYCGKVIGEFVCDKINCLDDDSLFFGLDEISNSQIEEYSCVSLDELFAYKGDKEFLYAWHISSLVIYDKPKELSEFYRWTDYDDSKKDKRPCSYCEHNAYDYSENCEYCSIDYDGEHCVHLQMKRPPQSWCYVDHPTEKGGGEGR